MHKYFWFREIYSGSDDFILLPELDFPKCPHIFQYRLPIPEIPIASDSEGEALMVNSPQGCSVCQSFSAVLLHLRIPQVVDSGGVVIKLWAKQLTIGFYDHPTTATFWGSRNLKINGFISRNVLKSSFRLVDVCKIPHSLSSAVNGRAHTEIL